MAMGYVGIRVIFGLLSYRNVRMTTDVSDVEFSGGARLNISCGTENSLVICPARERARSRRRRRVVIRGHLSRGRTQKGHMVVGDNLKCDYWM